MLGLRLDDDLEHKLDSLARRSGRSRSDIARDALRAYLADRDLAAEARRQSVAASQPTSDAELAFDDSGWTAP